MLQVSNQGVRCSGFIMGMQCQALFMNAKMIEQGRAVARILACNSINCIEYMQRTQGDIT
jgi:hypothetical protein